MNNLQDVIGQIVESSDYTGAQGEFYFDLVLSGGDTLRIGAGGRSEIYISAEIGGERGVIGCFGKTISAVDYDGGTDRCTMSLEFEDGSQLECRAGGSGEVWINAEIL